MEHAFIQGVHGPEASGSRPMPSEQPREPGGWNRIVLRVRDLPAFIETLKKAGVHFRNDTRRGSQDSLPVSKVA